MQQYVPNDSEFTAPLQKIMGIEHGC